MFIYLATPYSDPSPHTRKLRYQAARAIAADIADRRIPVYCPILQWHSAAEFHNMPTDVDYWWQQNEPFLRLCHEAWFVKLDGYENSKGIQRELNYCMSQGINATTFELPELYVYLSSYRSPSWPRETNVLDSGGSPRK